MAIYVFAYYTHDDDGFQREGEADKIMSPYSDKCIGRGTDLATGERDIQWEVSDSATADQAAGDLERAGFRSAIRSY